MGAQERPLWEVTWGQRAEGARPLGSSGARGPGRGHGSPEPSWPAAEQCLGKEWGFIPRTGEAPGAQQE